MLRFGGTDNNDIGCEENEPTPRIKDGRAVPFVQFCASSTQHDDPAQFIRAPGIEAFLEEEQAANYIIGRETKAATLQVFSIRHSSALRNQHSYHTSAGLKIFGDTCCFTLQPGHSRSSSPRVQLKMRAAFLLLARILNGQSHSQISHSSAIVNPKKKYFRRPKYDLD